MSFLSDDAFKGREGIFFAPMIDFLFLMLMFFACLAISRNTTKATDLELVKINEVEQVGYEEMDQTLINIHINAEGLYSWVTEIKDYPLESTDAIFQELTSQYEKGILPQEKEKTHVLLKIDKDTKWEPILNAVFAIRKAGFNVFPIYEPITN